MNLKLVKGGKGMPWKEWDLYKAGMSDANARQYIIHQELTFKAGISGCPRCNKTKVLCVKHKRQLETLNQERKKLCRS